MSDEARAEAERRWPTAHTYITQAAARAFRDGAEWQASRKAEAAPSDTDREALRKALRDVLTGASVQGDSERGADAVLAAGFSRSQPVQVEVTEEMVEKAAKGMWELRMRPNEPQWGADLERGVRLEYLKDARAALTAALGGGE